MTSLSLAFIGFIWLDHSQARHGEARSEARRGRVIRRLIAVLRQRRWQQAPPISQLSDHMRRDIGLPAANESSDWLWHR